MLCPLWICSHRCHLSHRVMMIRTKTRSESRTDPTYGEGGPVTATSCFCPRGLPSAWPGLQLGASSQVAVLECWSKGGLGVGVGRRARASSPRLDLDVDVQHQRKRARSPLAFLLTITSILTLRHNQQTMSGPAANSGAPGGAGNGTGNSV